MCTTLILTTIVFSAGQAKEDGNGGNPDQRADVNDQDKERNEGQGCRQNHLFHLSSDGCMESPLLEQLVHLHRVHYSETESEQRDHTFGSCLRY